MRKIAISLSKGGVGKTTTAVNLADGLARTGFDVLLVDTDTQGQVSYMLGLNPEAGLAEVIGEEIAPEEALVKARERLWILAGGKSLAGIKRIISRKDFGGEQTLTEALNPLSGKFDYVIVDTSPGWDSLTINVLFYVKEVLSPVSLEVLTLKGFLEFSKSLTAIEKYNSEFGHRIVSRVLPSELENPRRSANRKGLHRPPSIRRSERPRLWFTRHSTTIL